MATAQPLANALVSAMAQPAALLDVTGLIVACNDDFRRFVSGSLDKVDGGQVSKLLRAQDVDGFAAFMDGSDDTYRTIVIMPFGQFRFTLNRVGPDEAGAAYLCQMTPDHVMDSSRLRFLLEHLDQGVWNYNVLTETLVVTDAWRRMRGLPLDVDLNVSIDNGQHWTDVVHPEDRDAMAEIFSGAARGSNNGIDIQYRRKHTDGHWVWILCRASVMSFDHTGAPAQIVGLDTDITHIKENEWEVTQLVGKLQLAIDVAQVGVWEFNSETETIHWDDRVLEMYGLPDGMNEHDGALWDNVLHPDDRDKAVEAAASCLAAKGDFACDYRIIRPDGQIRHIRDWARFVEVPGTAGKMLGAQIDITDDVRRAEELEQTRQKLEYDSRHDALTGLANRRLLDETTQTLLARLSAQDKFAVLHLDLDNFKQINDTLGHTAGDAALVHVADILKRIVGETGLVCRNGGDEFVVLLYEVASRDQVEKLCRTITKTVAEPMVLQGQVNNFGVSIGGAISQGDVTDTSEVFINADVALYAAKYDGKGQARLFKAGMTPASQREHTQQKSLSDALKRCEITCYYQPQFDAKTHEIIGAEALVRWICPDRGLISPDEFIPMAQKAGMVPQLDDYVFNHVLEQQTIWAERGMMFPTISLNISRERLDETGLSQRVIAALKPHHRLSFELLETSFLDDADVELIAALSELRAAGIGLDLDDFGSGHSSIVAMQALRPDRVKIDRNLVAPLCRKETQIQTLRAMIQIAALDGCGVIIEGIETQAQLALVSELECDALQGYVLARPLSAVDFEKYLTPMAQAVRT